MMNKYIQVLIVLNIVVGVVGCNGNNHSNDETQQSINPSSIQPVMVADDKPFLPQEIVDKKITIGISMKYVRSQVNYLREPDLLPFSIPNYVISKDDMSSRCYFRTIKISYRTSYFRNVVDEILLTQRIEDRSEERLVQQSEQFIQYCNDSFGEPVRKYTKRMQMYKSNDHTYTSCILWMVDEQAIMAWYYSKLMREDLLEYMGEEHTTRMFGAVRLWIKPEKEGERILEEVRQLEEDDSEYKESLELYF
ncbi:MAG: hypothetical protein P9L94_05595 [Candidatus Hinthialibacter antarcticus]|nr:hypothetical protein [Candidatus Hinthialibacter antarcticus]